VFVWVFQQHLHGVAKHLTSKSLGFLRIFGLFIKKKKIDEFLSAVGSLSISVWVFNFRGYEFSLIFARLYM